MGAGACHDIPPRPETVQAVIGWYGPYDFATMDEQFKASGSGCPIHGGLSSAESLYLGAPVARANALAASANPATYLTPDDPPMLLQAGTNDPIVPVEQTMNFAAAAVRVLGPEKVTLRLLKEAGHCGNAFEAVENLGFVMDWLDRATKLEFASRGREPFRLSGQRSSNR